jgi:hypothetical protein
MNDFTKEDLSLLKNGIQYLSDRTSLSDGYLSIHNALESKIQSLIDNYCDHEKTISDSCLVDCCKCGWVGFK